MFRTTIISVWAVVFLAVAGCTDPNGVDDDARNNKPVRPLELIPQVSPPILDLPVPIGYELDESRSRHHKGAGFRWLDHRYLGNTEKHAVLRFYRRHMETKGWKLMSEQFAQGAGLLSFEKIVAGYTEGCTVRVASAGAWGRVEIVIGCGPRGPMTVLDQRK